MTKRVMCHIMCVVHNVFVDLVDRGQARDITSDNHDDDESCPDVGYRMARLSAATCTAAVSTSKRRREREWEDHALPRGEC